LDRDRFAREAGLSAIRVQQIERGLHEPSDDEVAAIQKTVIRYDPDRYAVDDEYVDRLKRDPNPRWRPGKRSERDEDCGIKDEKFWRWWDREGKRGFGRDLEGCKEIIDEYNDWQANGSPDADDIVFFDLNSRNARVLEIRQRWNEIESELASVDAGIAVPPGELDRREVELLRERDALEYRAGLLYLKDRRNRRQ
jgi:transcriptional regulator with XRE-family HTH domain